MADGSKMVRISVPDSKVKPTALTCSPQAQEHGHPEDPEEDEDCTCPQWLEQQERRAANGFICDPEKFNCQILFLSQDKNQDKQNCLVRKG